MTRRRRRVARTALFLAIALPVLLVAPSQLAGEASLRTGPGTGGAGPALTGDVPLLAVVGTVGSSIDYPTVPIYDPADGYVYVGGDYSRNITVIHGSSIVTSIAVPENPMSGLYDPWNGYLYWAGYNGSDLEVISGTTILANLSLGASCPAGEYVPTSGTPAADPANGLVYVPVPCAGEVVVVNGTSIAATVDVPMGVSYANLYCGATYDPQDGYVYVSDGVNDSLFVLHGTSLVATLGVEPYPSSGTYDPGNGLLYVTQADEGNVTVVNGTAVEATVTLANGTGHGALTGVLTYPGTYDSANGLVYVPYQPFDTDNPGVAILNGTTELTGVATGSEVASSASYAPVPYGNGTGFVYATTAESLNGGLAEGELFALGGETVLGTVNFTALLNGSAYDPENGLLYVSLYLPAPAAGGPAGEGYVELVACASCSAVAVNESGAPSGTTWSLTAANRTTLFAEQEGASAPQPIVLHLANGTYALRPSGVPGVTVRSVSANAVYSPSNGTLTVGGLPHRPTGSAPGPRALLSWADTGALAGGAATAIAASVALIASRRRYRREGEQIVRAIEKAIQDRTGGKNGPT